MTDEKKTKDLRPFILTAGGDPLPTDPETGEIDIDNLTDEQREQLAETGRRIVETLQKASPAFNNLVSSIRRLSDVVTKATGTTNFSEWSKLAQRAIENMQPLQNLLDELRDLKPYIKEELKKEEYGGLSFDDVVDYTPGELLKMRNDPDSLLYKLLEAARAAKADSIEKIDAYTAYKMDLPTDKINLFAWDLKETGGQIRFDLSRSDAEDQAFARFALTFDDDPNVKITKEINHFDKRVMSACGTAFSSGYPIISATGIYYAMGGTGRPGEKHLKKINDSLTKLDMAKVFLDNREEAELYNYPHFVSKEDRLLHMKRVSKVVNGKRVDSIIQILEEPVLMTFARQRKQISTIPIEVLQSPVTKTDNHMKIEDYLLIRIVRQKNVIKKLQDQQKSKYTQNRQKQIREAQKLTILLKTFYEHTGYSKKDTTAKKRARDTATDYLNHYQSEKGGQYITSYKIDKERITITLPIK